VLHLGEEGCSGEPSLFLSSVTIDRARKLAIRSPSGRPVTTFSACCTRRPPPRVPARQRQQRFGTPSRASSRVLLWDGRL
jgi:hypothetical protein